mgnify:FL=1
MLPMPMWPTIDHLQIHRAASERHLFVFWPGHIKFRKQFFLDGGYTFFFHLVEVFVNFLSVFGNSLKDLELRHLLRPWIPYYCGTIIEFRLHSLPPCLDNNPDASDAPFDLVLLGLLFFLQLLDEVCRCRRLHFILHNPGFW